MPSNVSASSHSVQQSDDFTDQQQQHSSPSSPQSSFSSSNGSRTNNNTSNNSALVPGGVVTTHNISTVIKPKDNNNSLQFVKIQTPELSKKAVEQIKLAEETKISKNKIKEVDEEWQNNLHSWKSKRRQQFSHSVDYEPNKDLFAANDGSNNGRKIKTFAEMIEQRAKSGNRLHSFHLQRYIGDDEQEDNRKEEESQNVGNNNGILDDDVNSKIGGDLTNRTDSDCEAQSSASSGYNQLDSKSPSSPEIQPLRSHEKTKTAEFSNYLPTSMCDTNLNNNNHLSNNLSKLSIDEGDKGYIMSELQDNYNVEHINSTFKQDLIRLPQVTTKTVNKPSLHFEVDTRNNEVSASKSEDESDNSAFEDEEEEEQKQLQRIAFEAKLKAFEKLTVPGAQKPQTPKPNRQVLNKTPNIAPPIQSKPNRLETAASLEARKKLALPSSKPIPPAKFNLDESLSSIQSLVKDNQKIPENLNLIKTESSASNSIQNRKLPLIPPLQQQQQYHYHHHQQHEQQMMKSQQTIKEVHHQPIESNNLLNSSCESNQSVQQYIPDNILKSNATYDETDLVNQKSKNVLMQQTSVPEPTSKGSQVPPRKLSKDDKNNRTVLSVSGKKRCSSCKEELGRGAAAFVVESLSLVYHTNCFRCSVCHVNLANGFRGVDVRVHAGALHCQNCYSRDGLNFSRV